MTVIAACYDRETNKGAMASDSIMTGAYVADYGAKYRKIGSYLIGCSGSTVGGAFLATVLGERLKGSDDLLELARKWRAWATDRGHTDQRNGLRAYPSNFLLVGPGGIFEIDEVGELLRMTGNYGAIGCGSSVAMGAMWALTRVPIDGAVTPNVVASLAVQAAMQHADSCGGQMHVESIEWKA